MFRNDHIDSHLRSCVLALAMVAGVTAAGCGGDDGAQPASTEQPASATARVKFKGPHRIASDLAQALSIPRQELCQELGSADCFETHGIVLGGVEPYRLRIDEPLPEAPVTAPMAVDRIALSACGERAARDFAAPADAVIFVEIAGDAAALPSTQARAAVAGRLYERLLARRADAAEVDALVAFGDQVADHAEPARRWAQLACYAVATTTENLFY